MTALSYKNNDVEIKYLLKLLVGLSPLDDMYQYLMNELLIYVYTSYENFLKKLLIHLFTDAKKHYKYYPFLVEHTLWRVTKEKSFIVPKGKIDDLQINFPLIKESYFIEELSAIDTLIVERNSFAHTGQHNANLEQILNAYVTSQYIMKYLEFCYVKSVDIDITNLLKTQNFLKEFKNHTKGCLESIKGVNFHEDMRAFDVHCTNYETFLSDGVFNCHPEILELLKKPNLNFLLNYKSEPIINFKNSLEKLKKELYLGAFKVPDKSKLTTVDLLDYSSYQ